MLIYDSFDLFVFEAWRPRDSYVICPDCNGSGKNRKKRKQKCPVCNGSRYNHSTCGVCYKEIDLKLSFEGDKTFCECRFNDDGTIKVKK